MTTYGKDPELMSVAEIAALPLWGEEHDPGGYDDVQIHYTKRRHESGFPIATILGTREGKWGIISNTCDVLVFDGGSIHAELLSRKRGLRCWRNNRGSRLVVSGRQSTVRIK
jgi:hypothetical protein